VQPRHRWTGGEKWAVATVGGLRGAVLYTLVIKGNTVVHIDPPGRYNPLYQRAHYRENQVRWRKMKRFVTQEHIEW
jgi:hypothetical protein